jgi:hypothetical protein
MNDLPVYIVQEHVLKKLRDPWRFTDEITARAALIIGEDGRVEREAAQPGQLAPPAPADRQHTIGLAYFGADNTNTY